jgi:hypothetical protein
MRVSARLRNLVYPAISRNDNHCGNAKGDRALRRVAKQRAALFLASYAANAGIQYAAALRLIATALEYGIAGLRAV